eukprot:TRINITY_DN1116_c1_g1_i1.p1 TRINITY_DN1116_c1_g1~~TRINITY_DN1116_c1_g1_i1.p1  ORF type:complete len:401 (+),score=139.20 TRINITY_DN1116_c1_g1_i1:84-1205(+)
MVDVGASRRTSAATEASSDMFTAAGSPTSSSLDATARTLELDGTVGSVASHGDICPPCPPAGAPPEESLYVTPDGDAVERRWCNFLYASKCPFCVNHSAGTMEPCRFMHLDVFVRLPAEERRAVEMPNLMTRHMKGLAKELHKVITARAAREVSSWLVKRAWNGTADGAGGGVEALNPYAEFVAKLRKMGWVIEEPAANAASTAMEDMPYAKAVAAIISVAVQSLHYGLGSCSEIMFDTLAAVFRLNTPSIRCPEPDLGEDDIMVGFFEGAGASFDTPLLTFTGQVAYTPQATSPPPAAQTPKQKRKVKALTGLLLAALPPRPPKAAAAAPPAVHVDAAALQAFSAMQQQQMHALQQQVTMMQMAMMQSPQLC